MKSRQTPFGALPDHVPGLVPDLLNRAKDSDIRILICSCAVHDALEAIHPFADGSRRVGRLWYADAFQLLRGWVEEGKRERFRAGKTYAYWLAAKKKRK